MSLDSINNLPSIYLCYAIEGIIVTAHGKTYVNDLRKHSLKSFVDRSLVVRNFYPFVKSF